MSPSTEPPADEASAEGNTSPSGPRPRRRLRAKRVAPPLRLIDAGDTGVPGTNAGLDLASGNPLALMRLGRQDLDAGAAAIRSGSRPSAVITGLGETGGTTSRARRLFQAADVPWLADPLLFRTAVEGYRTRSTLQELDYTPGRDGDPYQPEEFDDGDLVRRVGRQVVGAQVDLQAGAVIGGAFVVSRAADPWLSVNQELLRVGAEAAAAWGLPFIAALPVRMSGFEDIESQRLLIRALASRRPDAWLLMADGLSEDHGVNRIVAGLRLSLALQAASSPVILARSGGLRRLALSFGIAGVEFGLGRMLRFSVPDFSKPHRGPGPTPGPRMELTSIGCSLGFTHARRLLAEELISEIDCECGACTDAASLEDRMAHVGEHNAHAVIAELTALTQQQPLARVAALEGVLQAAIRRSGWLDRDERHATVRPRVDHQRRVLQAAVQAGLLEPARIAAELRLPI